MSCASRAPDACPRSDMTDLLAILDIGKSNAKLSVVDGASLHTLWSVKRANESAESSGLRQLDVVRIDQWLLAMFELAPLPLKRRVSVIVPIAHGAAAVLIDDRGEIVAAPDYEDAVFDGVEEDYAQARDAFASTYSPRLPRGLNLGRQWFYLERNRPELFTRAAHALLYPQYWAWRLCGERASEVTSLGCHTDLWWPQQKTFSKLVEQRHWQPLLPPLRFAGDTLGTITPAIASRTGLSPDCRVSCGIHDSNASYLQHLLGRSAQRTGFCVISSGTWTVTMAHGAQLSVLRPERDMLASVDAYSSPVCTVRFMGGREYHTLAQTEALPDAKALAAVLHGKTFALPSFAPGGPFPEATGTIVGDRPPCGPQSASLATLYVALMSDLSIDLLRAGGDVFLDGPLASNPLFGRLLATWRPDDRVFASAGRAGCNGAAAYLGGFTAPAHEASVPLAPLSLAGLAEYRQSWRQLLPEVRQ
jgi:L-fuculokinase